MRLERRVLAACQELGSEPECALVGQSRGLRVGAGREHVELRRARRSAERRREAAALAIEVRAVQDAARELVLPDEGALDREGVRVLVDAPAYAYEQPSMLYVTDEAVAFEVGEPSSSPRPRA